ncbi:MAG: hypothetical protein LBK61_03375 [Spirochaetaceae bacterium]|nr:hypothetical protein [Spirochaetaceae bacterium]
MRIIFDVNPIPILAANQRQAGTLCGSCASPAECPCGERKPFGFSSHCESFPSCESYPDSGRGISGRQARYAGIALPLRSAPAGGENPAGFSSLCETCPFANHTPILAGESAAGRQNTAMRRLCFPFGRAMPPHGGILPAGNDAG